MSGKKNGNEYILDLCKEFKDEKFFGYFSLGKPMLVVQDLEMVKTMKTKDFRHFPDTQDENISRRRSGFFVQSQHRQRQGGRMERREIEPQPCLHLWQDEGDDEVHRRGLGEPA